MEISGLKRLIDNSLLEFYDENIGLSEMEYESILKKYSDICKSDIKSVAIKQHISESINNIIVNRKLASGISIGIGTAKDSYIICKGDNNAGKEVTEDVLFDMASVTKLFLAIVYLKLDSTGILSIDEKVGTYTNQFQNLSEFVIKDIMNYTVELRTDKRMDMCLNEDEALQVMYRITGEKIDEQKYSDMPALVLGELLEIITGKKFSEWLDEMIIRPLGLKNFRCSPIDFDENDVIMDYSGEKWLIGNELSDIDNSYGMVHDPKARLFSKLCGHAGIFASAKDMCTVAKALVNGEILDFEVCKQLVKANGFDICSERQSFGYFCYRKFPDKRQTEVPFHMSTYSLASTGYTGTYLLLDFLNKCFVFIGSNRLGNRISKVLKNENSAEDSIIIDGIAYVNSMKYVYAKDEIRDVASEISLIL